MDVYWISLLFFIVIIAAILFFKLKLIFKKYKKIKIVEDPNFKSSKQQSQIPGEYLVMPVYISEKDDNPILIDLVLRYNSFIKKCWFFMGIVVVLIILGSILSYFYN